MWREERVLETIGDEDSFALIFDTDFLSIAYLVLLFSFFHSFFYN